jgi:hypothetical protein
MSQKIGGIAFAQPASFSDCGFSVHEAATSSQPLEHQMSKFEPKRSAINHPRSSQSKSTSHRIEISSKPTLDAAQLAMEFAEMSSEPPRHASLIIISVDNGDLIYIVPQTAEVVTSQQTEQNVECAA